MLQLFNEKGRVFPVTAIQAGPLKVTELKTKNRDGYSAVQIGYGDQKLSRLSKGQQKSRQKNETRGWRHLREFRLPEADLEQFALGQELTVGQFAEGDTVLIRGFSKGKGFQGVVKRHGFHGGPRSHGQKHSEREPGSIGGGLRTRVPKGMRMAGRMGGDKVTVKNLKIIKIDLDAHQVFVGGAVPGRPGTILEIRATN